MGNWDSMGRFGKGVGKGGKGEEWRSEGGMGKARRRGLG